jgi:Transmembrane secretion effector
MGGACQALRAVCVRVASARHRGRRAPDPLRERDLALLFAGKAVSLAGDGIYVVALAWQVHALSNVPAAPATVGLALSLPQVALFLVGGVLADRFDAGAC